MATLGKALAIAAVNRQDKSDKGGKPYMLHLIRVMMNVGVSSAYYDEDLMSIAILHDEVEDGFITINELSAMGFSDRVLTALDLLWHRKEVPYLVYVARMAHNLDACLVKLQDLNDNSQLSRLKDLTDKTMERQLLYKQAFVMVQGFVKELYRLKGFPV